MTPETDLKIYCFMMLASLTFIVVFSGLLYSQGYSNGSLSVYHNVSTECNQMLKESEQVCGDRVNSYKMYNGLKTEALYQINGLYFPDDDYYCIYAKNRTMTEQQKTEEHEYCHFLVDVDYEHFCED
jgi:hypothetical protein